MYQLRNVINRKSVPQNPEKNMKATEDFFLLILHAHVISAAKTLNPLPCTVTEMAKEIVERYTTFTRADDAKPKSYEDEVYLYATEVLLLSLIWHGFHDAIKEADGDRILRYWKFLLVIFKGTNHHNYGKEAVNLLYQYYFTFSESEKIQLLWNRCVNTKGRQGTNIPCDLFMEHLNRRLKGVIRSMGGNVKPQVIKKASYAIGPVDHVCKIFESQTVATELSDKHTRPGFGRDLESVLKVLDNEKVFEAVPGRCHASFNLKCGLLEKQSKADLIKKIKKNIQQLNDGDY